MKKFFPFVVLAFLMPFVTMCRPADVRPHFKNCDYNGAHSGGVVKLQCMGKGHNFSTALVDAKKAAAFTVASRMFKSATDRSKFTMIERRFYTSYPNFVKSCRTDGTISQADDGSVVVKAKCNVDRNQVVAFLKDNGVVNEQATREKIGNPSVAITTKWTTMNRSWNSIVQNSASEFLTSRQYNAIDLSSGMKGLKKLQQKVLNSERIPVDRKFRAAMMMGADIYVELAARRVRSGNSVKGVAAVKAFETTTGRLLGSTTSFGREYPIQQAASEQKTVKEAIQNSMEKVLTQVMGYWRSDVPKGNRYYVVMAGNIGSDAGDNMVIQLKRSFERSNVKCPTITGQRMICTVRSKQDPVEVRVGIAAALRKSGARSVRRSITTRKFLLYIVNQAAGSSNPDALPPGL